MRTKSFGCQGIVVVPKAITDNVFAICGRPVVKGHTLCEVCGRRPRRAALLAYLLGPGWQLAQERALHAIAGTVPPKLPKMPSLGDAWLAWLDHDVPVHAPRMAGARQFERPDVNATIEFAQEHRPIRRGRPLTKQPSELAPTPRDAHAGPVVERIRGPLARPVPIDADVRSHQDGADRADGDPPDTESTLWRGTVVDDIYRKR